jgi:Common central domain of tyrosinase
MRDEQRVAYGQRSVTQGKFRARARIYLHRLSVAKETDRMKKLLRLLLVAALGSLGVAAGASAHEHPEPGPAAARHGTAEDTPRARKTVRKNAAEMTSGERSRFKQAWSWAVRKGYFDAFNAEHFDHMRNRQHGADVQAGVPTQVMGGHGPAWGYRLLPWHRSFILEAEKMLNAAFADRRRAKGVEHPSRLPHIFIPYWDAANEQGLPRWVREFKPKGGLATVPAGAPKGHAAHGKPVGSLYRIQFNRWPGGHPMFDKLPPVEQIQRILANDTFLGFYNALDVIPETVQDRMPALQAAGAVLDRKISNDPDWLRVKTALDPNAPKDPASQLALFNSFLALGYKATVERVKSRPDRELYGAIKSMFDAFRFPPHLVLHFWAGGVDPKNPDLRGTITYFNELVVDPVFWMLHTELDRLWYTWGASHAGGPELTGEDATFQPITPLEGRWYGGGRLYRLGELTNLSALPYRYDKLWMKTATRSGSSRAVVRWSGTCAGPCSLAPWRSRKSSSSSARRPSRASMRHACCGPAGSHPSSSQTPTRV